jgi:hypothetical protein
MVGAVRPTGKLPLPVPVPPQGGFVRLNFLLEPKMGRGKGIALTVNSRIFRRFFFK